ncbi:hypothetical protein [Ilumatobacter sp.]|uniref:hypothetical protein n=1 Tax=Ilumatobacter sp. TaxID=1967498 RepID=UPI003C5B2178
MIEPPPQPNVSEASGNAGSLGSDTLLGFLGADAFGFFGRSFLGGDAFGFFGRGSLVLRCSRFALDLLRAGLVENTGLPFVDDPLLDGVDFAVGQEQVFLSPREVMLCRPAERIALLDLAPQRLFVLGEVLSLLLDRPEFPLLDSVRILTRKLELFAELFERVPLDVGDLTVVGNELRDLLPVALLVLPSPLSQQPPRLPKPVDFAHDTLGHAIAGLVERPRIRGQPDLVIRELVIGGQRLELAELRRQDAHPDQHGYDNRRTRIVACVRPRELDLLDVLGGEELSADQQKNDVR